MKKRLPADALYAALVGSAAVCVLAVAGLIFVETLQGSVPALRELGSRFLLGTDWDPVAERFGALPYIYGTMVTSGIALLLALPVGLGSAVFLSEIAGHRLGAAVSFVMEMLAAIPSIVYGIWGFFILAPFLRATVEPWLIQHFGFIPLFHGVP